MRNTTPQRSKTSEAESATCAPEARYLPGCPVAASVVDGSANATVRRAASDAFAVWSAVVAAALRDMRVPHRRAESLATLMISALERAILMARAERDVRALDIVVDELRPCWTAPSRRSRTRSANVRQDRERQAAVRHTYVGKHRELG